MNVWVGVLITLAVFSDIVNPTMAKKIESQQYYVRIARTFVKTQWYTN